ncbi:hypothetical protein [Archaeoglobus veneficus]|uniref:Uncharacterized protein n=1 Tax=Archaeoglobus veneficus (strain DSM 11195 / SNP6) TaxID=693661 RepID=F2KR46_ARCVS|nr:hypothetical protein [Archaeoglobus veneficus]AEA46683.1 hypothetical protein Arcve_0663 [Archaeoglobus veneficus SNP6]
MRLETFYRQPGYFARKVTEIQGLLAERKRNTTEQFEKDVLTFVINKLTELKSMIYFSYFIEEAKVAANVNNVIINDVDKIIRVGDEIKALFELKVRRRQQNGYIRVSKSEWHTLRTLSETLDVPVFYLVRVPGCYKLVKLNFWRTEHRNNGYHQLRDYYVKIPLDEGLTLSDVEVVTALADIIQEVQE